MRCQPADTSAYAKGLFTRVRGRIELVEKVDTALTATTNRARNAPEPVCLVADHGRTRAPREFFNTLDISANFALTEFSEVGSLAPAVAAGTTSLTPP